MIKNLLTENKEWNNSIANEMHSLCYKHDRWLKTRFLFAWITTCYKYMSNNYEWINISVEEEVVWHSESENKFKLN